MSQTKLKFLSLASLCLVLNLMNPVVAQQWSGSNTTSGNISRLGNVGIGIANPTRPFQLRGSNSVLQIDRDTPDPGFGITRYAPGFGGVWKSFFFYTQATGINQGKFIIADWGTNVSGPSTPRLVIDNTGNIGIGIENPLSKLHLKGDLILDNTVDSIFYRGPVLFTGIGSTDQKRYLNLINSPNARSASGLKAGGILVSDDFAYAQPGKNDMVVKGRIAIGTATSNAPLQFANDVRNRKVVLWEITNDDHQFYGLGINGNTLRYQVGWNGASHVFYAGNSTTTSKELMRIAGNGDVFISGFTLEHKGADFKLGTNDGRSIGSKPLQRALAHWNNDELVMNFGGDFEGGVFIDGPGLKTKVLTILGGADIAEPFEIVQATEKTAEPGSIVVIDENNPGKLKLSQNTYDRKVVGIISGANGVNPGMVLSQEEILGGGENVAISGRVYVKANLSNGAIKPGDLLTTSAVAGEAMKVNDYAQAQGAILGKAMTEINDKGYVLVFISLQ